ncbi:MAG: alanine dehydrogenase [Bacteroidia bacterium]|nr:alanine dehydrogenase [Bacteroidia bacterium]
MAIYDSPRRGITIKEKEKLLPQEEKLEIGKQRKEFSIGIPKETDKDENRIALTPLAVDLLSNNGHSVMLEGNAGAAANFLDIEYVEAGANIVFSREEIFKNDIIIKISPFSIDEIELLQGKQVIMSFLHAKNQPEEIIRKLMQKRITAIAYEFLKDNYDNYPIVRSMSEISGTTSILIAAEYLSNVHNGKGEMLGGITGVSPTEVIVLGSGITAEYATRTALGLGAQVKVFDSCIHRLREMQTRVGERLYTSVFQPRILAKALRSADIVIGAVEMLENEPFFIVTENMIMNMKKNSVIIDISIDQGGCFETSQLTSHSNPVFVKHGVIHYCVHNIASRVARTASYAISNILSQVMLNIGGAGGIEHLIKEDTGVRNGIYIYNGILTNTYIGELFGIPAKDINLLMAAF